MTIRIEEDCVKGKRYIMVDPTLCVVQSLSRTVRPCPICGGKTIRSAAGELLSPHKLVADETGAYGQPHRHRKARK